MKRVKRRQKGKKKRRTGVCALKLCLEFAVLWLSALALFPSCSGREEGKKQWKKNEKKDGAHNALSHFRPETVRLLCHSPPHSRGVSGAAWVRSQQSAGGRGGTCASWESGQEEGKAAPPAPAPAMKWKWLFLFFSLYSLNYCLSMLFATAGGTSRSGSSR